MACNPEVTWDQLLRYARFSKTTKANDRLRKSLVKKLEGGLQSNIYIQFRNDVTKKNLIGMFTTEAERDIIFSSAEQVIAEVNEAQLLLKDFTFSACLPYNSTKITTFYYFDAHEPTRLDTYGTVACETYATPSLPQLLCPRQEKFRGGVYERVYTGERRQIFFYMFPCTFAASELSDGEFDGYITNIDSTLDVVLPHKSTDPTFKLKLKLTTCPCIPSDVQSAIRSLSQGMQSENLLKLKQCLQDQKLPQEIFGELLSLVSNLDKAMPTLMDTVQYIESVSSVLTIPEGVINDSFIMQLKNLEVFSEMIIDGNKKGVGTRNITRFHLSKEDFYFYHKNNWNQEKMDAVNVTKVDDIDELSTVSGDSKLDASKNLKKNERQLIANMTKTGAMCVHRAALNGIVCKSVSVVGFLADYKTEQATSIRRMDFNLVARQSHLYLATVGSFKPISLESAFVRAADYLKAMSQQSVSS